MQSLWFIHYIYLGKIIIYIDIALQTSLQRTSFSISFYTYKNCVESKFIPLLQIRVHQLKKF
jgi:hypothetical protein